MKSTKSLFAIVSIVLASIVANAAPYELIVACGRSYGKKIVLGADKHDIDQALLFFDNVLIDRQTFAGTLARGNISIRTSSYFLTVRNGVCTFAGTWPGEGYMEFTLPVTAR